jgi:hypothetical protein
VFNGEAWAEIWVTCKSEDKKWKVQIYKKKQKKSIIYNSINKLHVQHDKRNKNKSP